MGADLILLAWIHPMFWRTEDLIPSRWRVDKIMANVMPGIANDVLFQVLMRACEHEMESDLSSDDNAVGCCWPEGVKCELEMYQVL